MLTMLGPRRLWSILVNICSLFEIHHGTDLDMCHVPSLDASKVYARVFWPVKSTMRVLCKQNSCRPKGHLTRKSSNPIF